MAGRRDFLKLGLAAGGAGLFRPGAANAQDEKAILRDMMKFLCPPDGTPPYPASPTCRPFVTPLFIPPVLRPVAKLDPPPDPRAHQRYDEFPPKKFYEHSETEFLWQYHIDPPYDKGSWSWGFNGTTPGPTIDAQYGEPIVVRIHNNLPPVGVTNVTFALPSTTIHLHNNNSASESD